MNKGAGVVGILGGSFDPVHKGHLAVAEAVLRQGLADEVWLMVSPENPLKKGKLKASESNRLNMTRMAVESIQDSEVRSRIRVSDFEFRMPRPSFTIHTLRKLSEEYPDRHFKWIVGGDNLAGLSKWYAPEEILQTYGLIVYPRPDSELPAETPEGVEILRGVAPYPDSSTSVREKIQSGYDPRSLSLPGSVGEYIKLHSLYIY